MGRRNGKNGTNKPQEWEPEPRELEIYALVRNVVSPNPALSSSSRRSPITRIRHPKKYTDIEFALSC